MPVRRVASRCPNPRARYQYGLLPLEASDRCRTRTVLSALSVDSVTVVAVVAEACRPVPRSLRSARTLKNGCRWQAASVDLRLIAPGAAESSPWTAAWAGSPACTFRAQDS